MLPRWFGASRSLRRKVPVIPLTLFGLLRCRFLLLRFRVPYVLVRMPPGLPHRAAIGCVDGTPCHWPVWVGLASVSIRPVIACRLPWQVVGLWWRGFLLWTQSLRLVRMSRRKGLLLRLVIDCRLLWIRQWGHPYGLLVRSHSKYSFLLYLRFLLCRLEPIRNLIWVIGNKLPIPLNHMR